MDLIFPRSCPGCGELLAFRGWTREEPDALCEACAAYWSAAETELCGICSRPVSVCTCMPNPMKKANIAGFCKLIYYRTDRQDYVTNRVIYRLKKDADAVTVRFLAREMEQTVRRFAGENGIPLEECVITYLPRGRRAVLKDGRDQAKLLASSLADRLDLPVFRVIGTRLLHGGAPQKQLSYTERLKMVRKTFCIRNARPVCGKCVLVVDDIVATGAGMEVGADLLYRAGADAVFSIAVASDEKNRYSGKKERSDGKRA